MHRRGMAMLNVLLVTTLIFLFSFAILNLALFHYQAARRQESSLKALEAAQSGLSETVRRLSLDPGFSQPLSGDIGGGHYEVNFTNNLAGFLPQTGQSNRPVPPHTAHLMSVGTSAGGGHRTIEAIVHLEALPFPVQSTGAITGHSLTVAGASTAALFIANQEKLPGSIYTGADLTLDGVSAVTGDIRTVGSANLAPTVLVSGQTEQGASPLEVPDLNISDFDNGSTPGVKYFAGGDYSLLNPFGDGIDGHRLQGLIYIDGHVHLTGPVLLDSAYIYVANGGNLTVDGLMTGKGSIFVTGETLMQSGAVINNDDQIAIFSQGDLHIKNLDLPLLSVFQGVLYSHSKIRLGTGVTVLGAVICKAANSAQGTLEFDGLNQIVHIPEHTAFASYWLARGTGGAPMKLDYWAELP